MLEAHTDGKALAHEIVDETLLVAQAADINVDGNKVHELIDFACANRTWHKPSMVQDLDHERMTEVDALNGYIVELAGQLGVSVPLNHLLLRLVRLRQAAPEFWVQAPRLSDD